MNSLFTGKEKMFLKLKKIKPLFIVIEIQIEDILKYYFIPIILARISTISQTCW